MVYNYLSIVNKVLQSFNEVPFSTSTEFDNATSFQLDIKEAVNDVLKEINNRQDQEWSFQFTETSQILTAGETGYTTPTDTADVDWDSFYIDKVAATEEDFTSVTASASGKTFTITTGSFITRNFAVGMKVRWDGVDDNATDVTINTLTATVMTVDETVVDATSTEFNVKNAADGFSAAKLRLMNIDTYRSNYLINARDADTDSGWQKPSFVVRQTDNSYIVGPLRPDATYLVRYDYFASFTDLTISTSVPIVPERYEYVILAGVKKRGNEFRDNVELAGYFESKFDTGIADMRRDLIPSTDTLRYEP